MDNKYIPIFILCIGIVLLFSYLGASSNIKKTIVESLRGHSDDTRPLVISTSGSVATTASLTAVAKLIRNSAPPLTTSEKNPLTFPIQIHATVADYYGNMRCSAEGKNGAMQMYWLTQNGTVSKNDPGFTRDNKAFIPHPEPKKSQNSGLYSPLYATDITCTVKEDTSAVCDIYSPGTKSNLTITISATGSTTTSIPSASGTCDETDYECLYGSKHMWPSSSGRPDFTDSNSAWANHTDLYGEAYNDEETHSEDDWYDNGDEE